MLDNLDGMPRDRLGELLESLQRGTLRLTRLIDNLLESVRIESGQLGIRHQSVSLAQVVDKTGLGPIPGWLVMACVAAFYLWLLVAARRSRDDADESGFGEVHV